MSRAPSKSTSSKKSTRKAPVRHCCGNPSLDHPRDHCPYSGTTPSSTQSTPAPSTTASTPAPQAAPALHVHNVFTAPATTPLAHHHPVLQHQGHSVSAVQANGQFETPTPQHVPPQQLQHRRVATPGPLTMRHDQWDEVARLGKDHLDSQPQGYHGEGRAEWELAIAGWRRRGRWVVDARIIERPRYTVNIPRSEEHQRGVTLCWMLFAAVLGAAFAVLILASLAR